jgi:hypothetical protein
MYIETRNAIRHIFQYKKSWSYASKTYKNNSPYLSYSHHKLFIPNFFLALICRIFNLIQSLSLIWPIFNLMMIYTACNTLLRDLLKLGYKIKDINNMINTTAVILWLHYTNNIIVYLWHTFSNILCCKKIGNIHLDHTFLHRSLYVEIQSSV